MPQFTASELADHLQGRVIGDASVVLTGFAPADTARPGDLTFAENESFLARAETSAAAAVLVAAEMPSTKTLIRVANARIAYARVLPLFFPEPAFAPGVHPTAVVAAGVPVPATAHLGPYVVVGERVRLGERVVLETGVCLGADCQIGNDSHLFPRVTLYAGAQVGQRVRIHAGTVIGSDGYGYVFDNGVHRKVPQVGTVIVQDDVEIGANVTIDRGALGSTVVGRGTKIDNLVQIGHNVVLGEHCLLVAQVGIAGSTRVGNLVTMAGQVGVAGHLKIGDRVVVAAQSGVMNDIPAGEKWLGAPARPATQMKRLLLATERLPDLLKRVAELERQSAPAPLLNGEASSPAP
jgi:UDP-3-O-[3-hydroxymyristoyl] glucosamine N-acyltransferase